MTLALLLLSLSMIPLRSFSAEHVTLSLQNATSTTNTIEFDVYIVNDGTTSLQIKGYAFGINFSPTILNGGTPGPSSYVYIAGTRDPAFTSLSGVSTAYNNNQLKATSTLVPSVNAVTLVPGLQYRLGRFSFTNTVNWLSGSVPNFQFQLQLVTGKTQCQVVCLVDGSSLSTAMTYTTNNLNVYSLIIALTLNVPLPVTLSSFSGSKEGSVDFLTWATSQELNNSHFNLQHSTDGISFSTIARINSKGEQGNSSTILDYSYTNMSPVSGHNYYRLEQVDIDGHATIESKVIDLERTSGNVIRLFPNPAMNILNVTVNTEKTQNTRVKVLDMNGRTIKTVQAQTSAGSQTIQVDINDLSVGSYFIQVFENGALSFTDKIKKVN